ncbi:MAG: methylated-DNA--[protein]-cysteine S-methyltransferase [Gammaproteobacteria bacterium]
MKSNNPQDFDNTYQTPIGTLGICFKNNTITKLQWLSDSSFANQNSNKKNDLISETLNYYFDTTKFLDKLELCPKGTPFQLKVWQRLQEIPSGETMTYGELAKELNTSSRAIGQACRTNPLVLFIPCHRIVSKTGLGGYMGDQKKVSIKSWLLEHESRT